MVKVNGKRHDRLTQIKTSGGKCAEIEQNERGDLVEMQFLRRKLSLVLVVFAFLGLPSAAHGQYEGPSLTKGADSVELSIDIMETLASDMGAQVRSFYKIPILFSSNIQSSVWHLELAGYCVSKAKEYVEANASVIKYNWEDVRSQGIVFSRSDITGLGSIVFYVYVPDSTEANFISYVYALMLGIPGLTVSEDFFRAVSREYDRVLQPTEVRKSESLDEQEEGLETSLYRKHIFGQCAFTEKMAINSRFFIHDQSTGKLSNEKVN